MTIVSMTIYEDGQMAVAWINHQYSHSCAALIVATLTDPRLLSESGRRILCCLLNFAVKPSWLTLALSPKTLFFLSRERLVVRG